MMKEIKQNEKGFTLVELVVVIAILAVLAALLIPRVMGNVEDARKSSAIGDARTIASEVATYNAQELVKGPKDTPKPILDRKLDDSTGIPELSIVATDMPDSTYVWIEVDDKGEVEVVRK